MPLDMDNRKFIVSNQKEESTSTDRIQKVYTRPHSAVGSMSGNRCQSDCRSKGQEFEPGMVRTFVEIDHEIISVVILLPSAESFKKGCHQLQAKVYARSTG